MTKIRRFFRVAGRANDAIQITIKIPLEDWLFESLAEFARLDNASVETVAKSLLDFAVQERYRLQATEEIWQLLTPRQQEIARCIAGGLSNSEIAEELTVSVNTIKTQNRFILAKFGLHSKEALRDALRYKDFS